MKISPLWVTHLKGKDKEDFEDNVYNTLSRNATISRLRELIQRDIDSLLQANKEIDYDSPSWANKQAHRNGRLEALQKYLTMLTTKE